MAIISSPAGLNPQFKFWTCTSCWPTCWPIRPRRDSLGRILEAQLLFIKDGDGLDSLSCFTVCSQVETPSKSFRKERLAPSGKLLRQYYIKSISLTFRDELYCQGTIYSTNVLGCWLFRVATSALPAQVFGIAYFLETRASYVVGMCMCSRVHLHSEIRPVGRGLKKVLFGGIPMRVDLDSWTYRTSNGFSLRWPSR